MFSLHGRATRWDWWKFNIIVWVGSVVAGILFGVSLVASGSARNLAAIEGQIRGFQYALMFLLLFPTFAVWTKRFQDRGKSWVWAASFLAPMLIFQVLAINLGRHPLPGQLMLVGLFAIPTIVLGLWAFIELGCLPGTPGVNRFDGTLREFTREDVIGEAMVSRFEPAPSRVPEVAMAGRRALADNATPPARSKPRMPSASVPTGPQGFGRRGGNLVRPRPIR
jgi:uncharacterized membrane protein YhaH (DUF805 family)